MATLYTTTHLHTCCGLPFAVFQNFRQRKDWRPKREKEPLQHFKGIMSRQQTLEKRETVRRQTTVNWFSRKTIFYTSSINSFQYKYYYIVDLILELICLIQYHLHHLEGGKINSKMSWNLWFDFSCFLFLYPQCILRTRRSFFAFPIVLILLQIPACSR